ncbi:MAG TPA: nicotinate phosphoribosyltransferase [Longimicrobiales bacterium]
MTAGALLTDLYQLTMMQAYWRESMHERAVFSVSVRRISPRRNYLIACGLAAVIEYLERLRFSPEDLEYLATLPQFEPAFLDSLREFRFTGDVHAVPEGTPVFADEPILEVVAPLPEAQLVETFVLNALHLETLLASKAARVVAAAAGRTVVDFGMRRIHGADAALRGARAFRIAGVDATSNVLAGRLYGIPVSGTMAHSYIQAHDSELDAFRAFTRVYPDAVLLVDTYGTMAGVENVITLARELGDAFRVRAVRLDSGDLAALARSARARLDAAGLHAVNIFASGGLDEFSVHELVRAGAPIDGFGVGTAMGVSKDYPALDIVYKLAEYAGSGRVKTSPGKPVLPGRKQVFRSERDGVAIADTIAIHDEAHAGRPLLRPVMRNGRRIEDAVESMEEARARAAAELGRLPEPIRAIEPAPQPYTVRVSAALDRLHQDVIARTS